MLLMCRARLPYLAPSSAAKSRRSILRAFGTDQGIARALAFQLENFSKPYALLLSV